MLILYNAIHLLFRAVYLLLFVRVIISWIPHDRYHPLVEKLYALTDPILEPFQRLLPPQSIGIDLSPIFAFFALNLLENAVFSILF